MFHAWFYLLLLSSRVNMVSIMPFALLVNNKSKMIWFFLSMTVLNTEVSLTVHNIFSQSSMLTCILYQCLMY